MQTRLYLTADDHGRALSWEEFAGADTQEGFRYEIIEGRLFVSPIPSLAHDEFADWLKDLFRDYARQRPDVLSRVKGPARVFLPQQSEGVTAPEPDVACYAQFPSDRPVMQRDWRAATPVLVVEVISPDAADKDLSRNRRLYLQVASIQEYWILDPGEDVESTSLIVYRRRGDRWAPRRVIPAGGTYATPLLPGFSLVLDPNAV